jgi:hypothetical protein
MSWLACHVGTFRAMQLWRAARSAPEKDVLRTACAARSTLATDLGLDQATAGSGRHAPPAAFGAAPLRASPDNSGLRTACAARSLRRDPSQGLARQQAAGTDRAWALGRGVRA